MLTILHDELEHDGRTVEVASCNGFTVIASRQATCLLARTLIDNGHDRMASTRVVRADPYLFGPPHSIEGITLLTAAVMDFFGSAADPGRATFPDMRPGKPVRPFQG